MSVADEIAEAVSYLLLLVVALLYLLGRIISEDEPDAADD